MPYLPPCSALLVLTGIWICIPGSDEKRRVFCPLLIRFISLDLSSIYLIEYTSIKLFSLHYAFEIRL